jgi:hypothetical protein
LAKYLQDEHDAEISVVTVRSAYAGGGSKSEPVGTLHEIGSLYDGKNKLLRLTISFLESLRLIWKARRLSGSQTIVMTDPPFLSFWAALLLGNRRNWCLWSMDLFPDAFVAGQFVSAKGWHYRMLNWIVYRTAPRSLIALGPLQADYVTDKYGTEIETALIPCGVFQPNTSNRAPTPDWKQQNADKIILGYCGNLGEAHSTDFLKAVVDHLDPTKFHLILSLYGVRAKEFLEHVPQGTPGISLVPSVSREELSCIDIHLVSLLQRWAHVCVPSKAVSAVCSGSAFLFYGTKQCDNWYMLQNAGWIVEESDDAGDLQQQVSAFLSEIQRDEIAIKKRQATATATALQNLVSTGYSAVAGFGGNQASAGKNPS